MLATRKLELIPGGLQNFFEIVVGGLESFVVENIGEKGRKVFPFLAGLFLFIITCNVIGLVPGFDSPTNNVNTNAAMARKKTVTPAELWLWLAYRDRLLQDIAEGKVTLSKLIEERERCRRTAVVRAKDRKLLDKLKSNKAKRHAIEENLAEQKENDEMASVRYRPPVA